jgi:hypothetical protein
MIPVTMLHLIVSGKICTAHGFLQRSQGKYATQRVVEAQKVRGNSANFALLLTEIGSGHSEDLGEPLVISCQTRDRRGSVALVCMPSFSFHTTFPQFLNW